MADMPLDPMPAHDVPGGGGVQAFPHADEAPRESPFPLVRMVVPGHQCHPQLAITNRQDDDIHRQRGVLELARVVALQKGLLGPAGADISTDDGRSWAALEAPGRIVGQYPPAGYSLREGGAVEVRVAGDVNRVDPTRRWFERQDPDS